MRRSQMSDAQININILSRCSNACTLGMLKLAVTFIRVFFILTESSYNKNSMFLQICLPSYSKMFIVVYTKIIHNILWLHYVRSM